MTINKLQLQVKLLTVNKNRVSENRSALWKITVAVAHCERPLTLSEGQFTLSRMLYAFGKNYICGKFGSHCRLWYSHQAII